MKQCIVCLSLADQKRKIFVHAFLTSFHSAAWTTEVVIP